MANLLQKVEKVTIYEFDQYYVVVLYHNSAAGWCIVFKDKHIQTVELILGFEV